MNKKALKIALIAMSLIALGALTVPFIGSLSSTSKSVENAAQLGVAIELDELAPGTYIEKASEYSRYIALRDFDGEVYVYMVRYYSDAYRIADIYWDRPSMRCVLFGPDASGNRLVEGGKIRCHDSEMSDWSRRESVWDYSGKSMGERTEDMPEAEYEVREGMLMISDSFWPLTDIPPDDT